MYFINQKYSNIFDKYYNNIQNKFFFYLFFINQVVFLINNINYSILFYLFISKKL